MEKHNERINRAIYFPDISPFISTLELMTIVHDNFDFEGHEEEAYSGNNASLYSIHQILITNVVEKYGRKGFMKLLRLIADLKGTDVSKFIQRKIYPLFAGALEDDPITLTSVAPPPPDECETKRRESLVSVVQVMNRKQ